MSLAKLLLRTQDLDSGKVTVFFPPGLSLEELERDYDEGFELPQALESEWITYAQDDGMKVTAIPTPRADSEFIDIVLQYLRASEQNLCIAEGLTWKPGAWISESEERVLVFKNEVYFLVQGGSSLDEGSIRQALNKADYAWEMFGALTSLPSENAILPTQQELTEEQLRMMAERTVKIFTPAYDREGYLIWHKAR